MTTHYLENGSDDLDTKFEPYTAPFAYGTATNFNVSSIDFNKRYLAISALAPFHIYTLATDPDGPGEGYAVAGNDIYNLFPAKGSVNYTLTVPVTTNQVNLNAQAFVKNYLLANYPAYYDSSYKYFNNNYITNTTFTASNPAIILHIQSGVVVYSNDAGTPALTTGTFPSGVFFQIFNEGHIVGASGEAGTDPSTSTAGGNGGSGGDAVYVNTVSISVNNGNGFIFAGGGGGGSGGPAVCEYTDTESNPHTTYALGGIGGAGAGGNVMAAGSGIIGAKLAHPGSSTGNCTNAPAATNASWGGDGGDYGAGGNDGFATTAATNYLPVGSGGLGGNSVVRNGHTVTFTSGNTGTRVKGPMT